MKFVVMRATTEVITANILHSELAEMRIAVVCGRIVWYYNCTSPNSATYLAVEPDIFYAYTSLMSSC